MNDNIKLNKHLNRIFMIVIIMVIASTAIISSSALAAQGNGDNPDFKLLISKVDMENQTVFIDVVAGNNSNIAAGAFTINYNEEHLTYSSANIGSDVLAGDGEILINDKLGNGQIIFSYLNISPFADETTLLTLAFDVKSGYHGKTDITVFSDDVIDYNFNEIKLDFHNLTFEIPENNIVQSNHFTDVKKGQYYYDSVLWAVENSITNGASATKFDPAAQCTRGQVATFLWRTIWKPQSNLISNPFTDLEKNSFYEDAVLWAYENGITTGTSTTTFSPDATVTRAQFVTFLWRMAGEPSVKRSNPFKDVPTDTYYTDAVLWAYENGITNGTSATTFAPDKPCLRQEVVTFLYRAFK